MKKFFTALTVVGAIATPAFSTSAADLDIVSVFSDLIENHDKVQAAAADVVAAEERYEETWGKYYPDLDVSMSYGYDNYVKPSANDTSMVARKGSLTLTQLITDFGALDSEIKRARLDVEQASLGYEVAEQELLLEAITAYLSLLRAAESYKHAEQSVANFTKQYNTEEIRRDKGNGFLTDSLQAEAQLNGAMARLVKAEGSLHLAANHYRSVFRIEAPKIFDLPQIKPPLESLPPDLDVAVKIGMERNLQLRIAKIAELAAQEVVSQTHSDKLFPKIEAKGSVTFKRDYGGTVGPQREYAGLVEMNYPFNLGLTAFDSIDATKADLRAAALRYSDARHSVDEEIRNSWENYHVAVKTAKFLSIQADLTRQFLDRAKEERKIGKRSLIDVLSGEITLINAQSDASSAEVDVAIAAFTLLSQMGELDVEMLAQTLQALYQ